MKKMGCEPLKAVSGNVCQLTPSRLRRKRCVRYPSLTLATATSVPFGERATGPRLTAGVSFVEVHVRPSGLLHRAVRDQNQNCEPVHTPLESISAAITVFVHVSPRATDGAARAEHHDDAVAADDVSVRADVASALGGERARPPPTLPTIGADEHVAIGVAAGDGDEAASRSEGGKGEAPNAPDGGLIGAREVGRAARVPALAVTRHLRRTIARDERSRAVRDAAEARLPLDASRPVDAVAGAAHRAGVAQVPTTVVPSNAIAFEKP